jgi:hypothetical protein
MAKEWMKFHIDNNKIVEEFPMLILEAIMACGGEEKELHKRMIANVHPVRISYDHFWVRTFFKAVADHSGAAAEAAVTDAAVTTEEEYIALYDQLQWADNSVIQFWYNKEKNFDLCMKCAQDQSPEMMDFLKMTKYDGLMIHLKEIRGFDSAQLKCDSCEKPLLTLYMEKTIMDAISKQGTTLTKSMDDITVSISS